MKSRFIVSCLWSALFVSGAVVAQEKPAAVTIGYLNLVNALTEVVIAPAWIFQRGVLAYNGAIGFWVNVPVFGLYTVVFIALLRNFIQREEFRSGPLPEPPPDVWRRSRVATEMASA